MHRFISILIIYSFFSMQGCKDNPVVPHQQKKDLRNLTWTVDTLQYLGSYQTMMKKMWASSSKDVYIVGHNDQNEGKMFHYDGVAWKPVKLTAAEGGSILGPIDLADVYGFAANDIYAVGEELENNVLTHQLYDSSLILHYNGVMWQKVQFAKDRALFKIWGSAPNDIWVGGWANTAFHFTGGAWHRVSFPMRKTDNADWSIQSFGGNHSGDLFALGWSQVRSSLDEIAYCMKYEGGTWRVLDTMSTNTLISHKWGEGKIWGSPEGKIYSVGLGVFEYQSGNWVQSFDYYGEMVDISGTSSNNLIVCGAFGAVYHFDGNNWYFFQQFNFPNIVYSSVWTDGEEVFILGSDGYKSYILHGK